MFKVTVTLDKPIIPDKLFFDGKKFIITEVNADFFIKDYQLYLDDNMCLKKLFLSSRHPNCDPETGLFCLPEFIKKIPFCEDSKCFVYSWLTTFNLENCYFMPWGCCKYRLM